MGSDKVNPSGLMAQTQDSERISPGQLTLRGLRLKKGALDKFRLPIDVLEGAED